MLLNRVQAPAIVLLVILQMITLPLLSAQQPCQVAFPTDSLSIPYINSDIELNTDPHSKVWEKAASAWISKDCTRSLGYPDLKTEVKGFWTDRHLYLLFICPYRSLNLFLPAQGNKDRDKLWDKDVVEMFLGEDWQKIRHYREFEIAPTGDWVDLAIDLDKESYDQAWNSGWQTQARIDEKSRVWYAAAKIPLKSVSGSDVRPGTRWRMNLYRIDGEGPDTQRRFLCWQPTCVVNRDPNHVPEAFGTLVFVGKP
jgi:hypothetical protein